MSLGKGVNYHARLGRLIAFPGTGRRCRFVDVAMRRTKIGTLDSCN